MQTLAVQLSSCVNYGKALTFSVPGVFLSYDCYITEFIQRVIDLPFKNYLLICLSICACVCACVSVCINSEASSQPQVSFSGMSSYFFMIGSYIGLEFVC